MARIPAGTASSRSGSRARATRLPDGGGRRRDRRRRGLGAAHLCLGFPVYDRLGAQLRPTVGYRGSLALLIDAANCLLDQEHVTHQRTVMEEIPC